MDKFIKICNSLKERFKNNSFLYYNWKGDKNERILTLREALLIIDSVMSEADFTIKQDNYRDSPFGKLISELRKDI